MGGRPSLHSVSVTSRCRGLSDLGRYSSSATGAGSRGPGPRGLCKDADTAEARGAPSGSRVPSARGRPSLSGAWDPWPETEPVLLGVRFKGRLSLTLRIPGS